MLPPVLPVFGAKWPGGKNPGGIAPRGSHGRPVRVPGSGFNSRSARMTEYLQPTVAPGIAFVFAMCMSVAAFFYASDIVFIVSMATVVTAAATVALARIRS